jgi:hypothetical protein
MTNQKPPAATLISGNSEESLLVVAQKHIVTWLCLENQEQNCSCKSCDQIRRNCSYQARFFEPGAQYLVQEIEEVRNRLSLLLSGTPYYFFVFTKSERLSQATGNRLLKSIEEPPPGYHFIFLTTNVDEILPTIRSRCTHITSSANTPKKENPIVSAFLSEIRLSTLFEFEKILSEQKPDPAQSRFLISELLKIFIEREAELIKLENRKGLEKIEPVLELFKTAVEMPPPQGSSDLFWKQLFLSFTLLK